MIEKNNVNVMVLMATYNGEKYIREQIESILNQVDVKQELIVRDDGSSDRTISIVRDYIDSSNVFYGNHDGPSKNFWELLRIANQRKDNFDFFSFSDQDDIWDDNKLIEAVNQLKNYNSLDLPLLYYSNHRIITADGLLDEDNHIIIPPKNLESSLVRSDAQGCTMVFNKKMLSIASAYIPSFNSIPVYHDAFLHKLCMSLGGVVIYDDSPRISYRIHENNVVNNVVSKNPKKSFFNKLASFFVIENKFYHSRVANEILIGYKDYLPEKNKDILFMMAHYKDDKKLKRKILFSNKFSTGNVKKDFRFKYSVLLNKA